MGRDDDSINASVAHIALCCVAGRGISKMTGKSFTHPGMHANFFIHGVLGFLHYQSGLLDNDFKTAYMISLGATRYLALPCLMADLYRSDQGIASLHLISGAIPFALAISGNENIRLGNLMIACNIISLCHYSIQRNKEWGWYTAAAGILAYFISPQTGGLLDNDFKTAYMISLGATRYLALPCLMADLYRSDQGIASLHLISGAIPFALAISGNENIRLGNLMIACNIISLCHYSIQRNKEWGWYTAAAGILAYFISPQTGQKMFYPLTLALMQYCAYRVFHTHFDPPPVPEGGRGRRG